MVVGAPIGWEGGVTTAGAVGRGVTIAEWAGVPAVALNQRLIPTTRTTNSASKPQMSIPSLQERGGCFGIDTVAGFAMVCSGTAGFRA